MKESINERMKNTNSTPRKLQLTSKHHQWMQEKRCTFRIHEKENIYNT